MVAELMIIKQEKGAARQHILAMRLNLLYQDIPVNQPRNS